MFVVPFGSGGISMWRVVSHGDPSTRANRSPWSRTARALAGASLGLTLVIPSNLPATAADLGPQIQFTAPQPEQVVTSDTVTAVFKIDSRFPVESLYVELGWGYDEYGEGLSFSSGELPCDATLSRCEVVLGVPDWIDDGRLAVYARAWDVNGVRGPASVAEFTLERNQSGAVLYSPQANDVLAGHVKMKAVPTDGARSVAFYVNGILLGGEVTRQGQFYEIIWDTRWWPNGSHEIAVGGFDGNYDRPGSPISVMVRNPLETAVEISAIRPSPSSDVKSADVFVFSALDTAPLANRTVTLTLETPSSSKVVGRSRTGTDGLVRFPVTVRGAARLSATVEASGDYLAASSSRPVGLVTATFSSSKGNLRVKETFSWRVTTSTDFVRGKIQWFNGYNWVNTRSFSTGRNGRWQDSGHFTRAGRFTYRVFIPDSQWYESTATASIRFRVQ